MAGNFLGEKVVRAFVFLHLLVHYVFSIYLFKVKKTLCFAIAPFFSVCDCGKVRVTPVDIARLARSNAPIVKKGLKHLQDNSQR